MPIFCRSSGTLKIVMSLFMFRTPWRNGEFAKRRSGDGGVLAPVSPSLRVAVSPLVSLLFGRPRLHFVLLGFPGGRNHFRASALGLDFLQGGLGKMARTHLQTFGQLTGPQDADSI